VPAQKSLKNYMKLKLVLLNLFIILFAISSDAFSQDIILLKTGDEIKATVSEIGIDVIKYKKFDNPEGPAYTLKKSEVFMIKYANGTKDVFNSPTETPVALSGTEAQTFTDARDGVYKTVTIGNQVWMANNLNVDKFRNGDLIPEAKTDSEWKKASDEGKPAWCFYKNETANGIKYGRLYNWYAVNDPRQICPDGWHVATDEDWKTLENYLGGNLIAGAKLKSQEWESVGGSSNSSGFSALPGGTRFNISQFLYIGRNGYWWTSSSDNNINAICRQMCDADTFVLSKILNKKHGFSVRCVKD